MGLKPIKTWSLIKEVLRNRCGVEYHGGLVQGQAKSIKENECYIEEQESIEEEQSGEEVVALNKSGISLEPHRTWTSMLGKNHTKHSEDKEEIESLMYSGAKLDHSCYGFGMLNDASLVDPNNVSFEHECALLNVLHDKSIGNFPQYHPAQVRGPWHVAPSCAGALMEKHKSLYSKERF
ncbi:hypothetical protein M9H77_23248 [Catharanthus roseus]|uniref:Uncharacterized protein n=1 Tax=Catharanthus roseus TaxID=4058 RepID=A0ACC0ASS5_CATRO|nr:hypothetical protein M9H77_23248 [Catharanthus roseus]